MEGVSVLEQFRVLCERSEFPQRQEILDGLSTGSFQLTPSSSESGVPVSSMLEIYSRRSQHVQQFAANSDHARRMVEEIDFYLNSLRKTADADVRGWRVDVDERSGFSVFEGIESGKILGCIYGVDKRSVSAEEWRALWGE